MFEEMIYFILCSYGMTQILVYGKIFEKLRPRYYFFRCSMCVGFWVGMLLWAVSPFTSLFMFDRGPTTPLLLGCVSSGISYFLIQLVGDGGIRHEKMDVTTSETMP